MLGDPQRLQIDLIARDPSGSRTAWVTPVAPGNQLAALRARSGSIIGP
jgi:hypothetical protein